MATEGPVYENPEKIDAYTKLTQYPISKNMISYMDCKRYERKQTSTTFNDLITMNLHELIPNILLGHHNGLTSEEIETWIEQTDTYGKLVWDEFNSKCREKMRIIRHIRDDEVRRDEFVTKKLDTLPVELLTHIRGYMQPETRLALLESKYPNIRTDMQSWKVAQLKAFYRGVVHNSVKSMRDDYRKPSMTGEYDFRLTITSKSEYIDEIFKLLARYKSAIPRNVRTYNRYKKEASRLFMSVVYVNNKLTRKSKN